MLVRESSLLTTYAEREFFLDERELFIDNLCRERVLY